MIPLGILGAAGAFGELPVTTQYWNPNDKAANAVLSDSDRVVGGPSGGPKYVRSVVSKVSGKWRVQFVPLANVTNGASAYGFALPGPLGSFLGGNAAGFSLWGVYSSTRVRVFNNNSHTEYAAAAIPAGTVIDLLLDISNGRAWWMLNGTPIGGDPEAGTGAMATFTPGSEVFLAADPFVNNQATRLRTNPAEISGPAVPGFTDGWPD